MNPIFKQMYCPRPFKKRRERNPDVYGCWYCGQPVNIVTEPYTLQDGGRLKCPDPSCY